MHALPRIWMILALLAFALLANARRAVSQTNTLQTQNETSYRFNLAVDEVSLSFHASDIHGLPVNDLKLDELSLLDNGKPPRRILAFRLLEDVPLRAGILLDTSESMGRSLPGNRAISLQYAQKLLREPAAQAFVLDFGYGSKIKQSWTSDPLALAEGIHQSIAGRENPLGGTALFDAIFRVCLYEFGKVDQESSGNFILLFSDGEDNASHTSLQEAVNTCQHSNTAIYVYRSEPNPGFYSSGPRTLAELASETGGRVFAGDDSEAGIDKDLGVIEAVLRNQYRLIYNPAELNHDGSFHHIELKAPERVDSVNIRSGYYAPAQ